MTEQQQPPVHDTPAPDRPEQLDRLDMHPPDKDVPLPQDPPADAEEPGTEEASDAPVLLLCGDGPETRATALLARQCGFLVDVVDDAADSGMAQEGALSAVRRCLCLPAFDNLVEACGIGRDHYVAVMIREPELACHVLAQALESPAAYVGMLGGRRKRDSIYDILREEGVPLAELAVVRCPIGLPIGARSPQQVAVAIVAELLAAQAGTLQRLRIEE